MRNRWDSRGIRSYYVEFGAKLPAELSEQLDKLEQRVRAGPGTAQDEIKFFMFSSRKP